MLLFLKCNISTMIDRTEDDAFFGESNKEATFEIKNGRNIHEEVSKCSEGEGYKGRLNQSGAVDSACAYKA